MSKREPLDIDNSEEAEEVQGEVEDDYAEDNISESQGEDLIEDAEKDYQRIKELDEYERDEADFEEIELNPEARRKAERELNRRDQLDKEAEDEGDYLEADDDMAHMMRKRRQYYEESEQNDDGDVGEKYIDPEEAKGKLHLWIKEEETKRYIRNKFLKFLNLFMDQKFERCYYTKMNDMRNQNTQTLEISYPHFKQSVPIMALWLGLEPGILIPELNAILYAHLGKQSMAYKSMVQQVYVKFCDLPIHDRIRELNITHIEKLVQIKGVVTVRGEVFNQLKRITYKCYRCGEIKGPFYVSNTPPSLGTCRSCQSTGPYLQDKMQSVYRNHQRITVQQSPSDVDAGRIPRTKQVILTGDNVDKIKPGDEVEVIGIFQIRYECFMNIKQGFPIFTTFVEANSVRKLNDTQIFDQAKEQEFINFARKPDVAEIIYNSVATSIYGYPEVKKSIALALFGGIERHNPQKMHRVRGDINVLLLGDPGIAKSQFLKSIQKVFHRCVYATGKGASAVGLTASVKQDSQTNEWKLEAGAMVLADRGICLIDEFDKMNEHDRTSIHEAMEQQTISISKAGIVANLNARCTVIAAANPIQGRYNDSLSFIDNVSLSDPILSRFDIVKVIKDRCNEEIDAELSTFVINSHMENHPYSHEYNCIIGKLSSRQPAREIAEPEFLKQYIKYARDKYNKICISDKCAEMIKEFYSKLRASSDNSGGIRITTRHLESMIRICGAHAKMHLRNETIREDADVAIKVMLRSYIETQKHGPGHKIEKEFKFYL